MSAFFYSVALQWKMDIRSKTLLITCYVVPLLFFALMGGIFTSVNPQMVETLIPSMTVMGVSMGALIGLPPSIVALYGGDCKKMYQANGIPLYLGIASMFVSAFIHLLIMSAILYLVAPAAFGAATPQNPPSYFGALAIFLVASLSMGCLLGLIMKNQAKLTMVAQLVFLPSILLSGILFPADLLPQALIDVGKIFPATWGYQLMLDGGFSLKNLWPLLAVMLIVLGACGLLLHKIKARED